MRFARSSLILRPRPPASAAKSLVRVIILGLLSVISSSAPPAFLGSAFPAGAGAFFAAAAALGSRAATGSGGFGSSPSI